MMLATRTRPHDHAALLADAVYDAMSQACPDFTVGELLGRPAEFACFCRAVRALMRERHGDSPRRVPRDGEIERRLLKDAGRLARFRLHVHHHAPRHGHHPAAGASGRLP